MSKPIIFLAMMAAAVCHMPPQCFARTPEQQALYDAYKQRRSDRREYALVTRRAMNAGKVYRGWTAIKMNVAVSPTPAIQQGWIKQPPIPRRRTISIDSMMSDTIRQAEAFIRSY